MEVADQPRLLRESNHLLHIFPEDVWVTIADKLEDPEDLENLSNASLFFRKLLQDKQVLFLFPKVWRILADQYLDNFKTDRSFNETRPDVMVSPCCGQFPNPNHRWTPCEQCGKLHGIKWYSGILRLRLVCQTWSSVIDHLFQNQAQNYEWRDERPENDWNRHIHYNMRPWEDRQSSIAMQYRHHFEPTHGSDLNGRSTRNPFLTRKISLTYLLNGNCGDFTTDVVELFRIHGHHIWYFNFRINFTMGPGCEYILIRELLELMPNLKVFSLDHPPPVIQNAYDFANRRRAEVHHYPLPTLPNLQVVRVIQSCVFTFNELIRKNRHVSKLQTGLFRPPRPINTIYCTPLLNLNQLALEIHGKTDIYHLERSPHTIWPLKTIHLTIDWWFPDVSLKRIFALLETKWSNTLTELILTDQNVQLGVICDQFKSSVLKLPKLSRLELLTPSFFSLDFLLPMRDNLEILDVTVAFRGKLGSKRNSALIMGAERDQQVKLFRCGDRPLESNIWTLFPKLKQVTFHKSVAPVSRKSKVHVWTATKAQRPVTKLIRLLNYNEASVTLTKYTALHLACLSHKPLKVIKKLVEEAGADINSKTEGDVELTPLHILLCGRHWEEARYLIDNGADLNVRGNFKIFVGSALKINYPSPPGTPKNWCLINPVEFLVGIGSPDGLPLLDHLISKPGVPWGGSNEFQMAVQGENPTYILKVLQRCAKIISKQDLTWLTFNSTDANGVHEQRPSLIFILDALCYDLWEIREVSEELVDLLTKIIQTLVTLGYDLNLIWDNACGRDSIFKIFELDFEDGVSGIPLLQAILQNDKLQLNGLGEDLVWSVLKILKDLCPDPEYDLPEAEPRCKINSSAWPLEVLKLLVSHGLDVSEVVIRGEWFHVGCSGVFKMLYSAGAKFSEDFFTSGEICDYRRTAGIIREEREELKKWRDDFDKTEGLSLRHKCRMLLRKKLRCVGDVKILDELTTDAKDYVLCKNNI